MRVATYNTHDCVGRDRVFDPQRITKVILEMNVDMVALQEVTLDLAGDLLCELQIATNMEAIDGTLFERGVGRYGNLILSRHPLEENRLHDLSVANREPRGSIEAAIETEHGPLRIFATHLGLSRHERRTQIRRLAAKVIHPHHPTVVMGDFNAWKPHPDLLPLTKLGFRHLAVRSFPTKPSPLLALDRILVSAPIRLTRCWRHVSPLSRVASDHFPVVAEMNFQAFSRPNRYCDKISVE